QIEPAGRVQLTGKQAIAGSAQIELMTKLAFRNNLHGGGIVLRTGLIDQYTVDVAHPGHHQRVAFGGGDVVADGKGHARQWRIVARVGAFFFAGREVNRDEAVIKVLDNTEA